MTPKTTKPADVAKIMLSWHDLTLVECKTLQKLWAGYGEISAITARANTDTAAEHVSKLCGMPSAGAGSTYPLILKLTSAPNGADEGHLRKMFSYEVEQYFYSELVPRLDGIAVAGCLASTRDPVHGAELDGLLATIMVDLRSSFPVVGGKRDALNQTQVLGALDWLAKFHSRRDLVGGIGGYVLPPLEEKERRAGGESGKGVWLNGGYTYLATRRTEYDSLKNDDYSEWSDALCKEFGNTGLSVAETVALFLKPCGRKMESLIHGDVKSENLFTTTSGEEVAFCDFQYVGVGLGVCDLAKLFTCSVPMDMLLPNIGFDNAVPEKLPMRKYEQRILEKYYNQLVAGQGEDFYPWDEFVRHWETALVDWCRFQASWGFWGNTEWLEGRVRSILSDQEWRAWLETGVKGRDL